MKFRSTAARAAAVVLGGVTLVTGMQGQAMAASTVTISHPGGYGQWNPDPSGSIPGDAIRACDNAADGWGIEVWLDINRNGTIDRIASTRGHDSPYCSSWASGNIAEGTPVDVYVLRRKGDTVEEPFTVYRGVA